MADEDAYERFLRLVAPRGAYDWIEWPAGSSGWLTCSKGALKPATLRKGHPVGVRPHRTWVNFLVIDIDTGSPYHPSKDPEAVDDLRKLLISQGIECVIIVESSASRGIHLWAPLPTQSTPELARWLYRLVTSEGYEVAPGTLELFPNVISQGKLHNGIRLPLVASDSWILDKNLDHDHQSMERLCGEWVKCLDCNAEFMIEFSKPYAQAVTQGGKRAEAEGRLKRGFSDHGQTQQLAKDAAYIACLEGLKGAALQSRMCSLLAKAPGCKAWSRHWTEIRKGTYNPDMAKYYSKKGREYLKRHTGGGCLPRSTKRDRDPQYNAKKSEQRKSALDSAIRSLHIMAKRFPTKDAAFKYLADYLRETTGKGMSKTTFYKHILQVEPLIQADPN